MNVSLRMQRNYALHCCNLALTDGGVAQKKEKKTLNSHILRSCALTERYPGGSAHDDGIRSSIMAATSFTTWTAVPPQPTDVPPHVCLATDTIFSICFSSCYFGTPPVHTHIVAGRPNYSVSRLASFYFLFFFPPPEFASRALR